MFATDEAIRKYNGVRELPNALNTPVHTLYKYKKMKVLKKYLEQIMSGGAITYH